MHSGRDVCGKRSEELHDDTLTCASCAWFRGKDEDWREQEEIDLKEVEGQCFVNPPSLVTINDMPMAVRPTVRACDTCREHSSFTWSFDSPVPDDIDLA